MDLKGISWAGNIYEKFEAMCLEVEEVIYEDTMKYMENQVQKVGASVKKFYSEVMHDLLPPSYIDPVKVAAADLSPNPYGHDDVYKKSLRGLKKKEITNGNIHGITPEDSFPRLSHTVIVESTGSGLCSANSNNVGLQRRPIGIKRISQTNRPPRTNGLKTSASKDKSDLIVHDTRRVCTADMNAAGSAGPSVKCDLEEAKAENISVSGALEKPVASDNKLSAQPLRLEKDNSECTSSFNDSGVKDTSFSALNEDKLMKDGSLSCNTYGGDSFGEEVIVFYEENFDMELVDKEEVAESVQELKLEDTCISVESDLLHFIPLEDEKNKTYKKKLSEALSAKLRSKRKQNQYTSQNSADGVILDLVSDSNYTNVPAQESFGSDWELI